MADPISDYVAVLDPVISVCKDAEQGFQGAANAVTNSELKSLFEHYSRQRAGFAAELQAALKRDGGDPAEPVGVAGALHRGWIALKGVLTGHSEHQILEETERGEDLSVHKFRDALAQPLPGDLRTILETQFEQVRQGHNRIRSLRDAAAAK